MMNELEEIKQNKRSIFHLTADRKRKVKRMKGVYFLFRQDELVYIGQSRDIVTRLILHKQKRQIVFDSFAVIETDPHSLESVEALYINQYRPKFNKYIPKI
jgi:hypothetical protein